jgi:hypothetical protein
LVIPNLRLSFGLRFVVEGMNIFTWVYRVNIGEPTHRINVVS